MMDSSSCIVALSPHDWHKKWVLAICNLNVSRFLPPQDCLQPLSMQALPAQPESLCIVEMGGAEKQDELGERGSIGFLYLNIGLQVRRCCPIL